MIQSRYLSTLALAALLGAAPAFAQTSGASAQSSSTTQGAISKERASTGTSAKVDSSSSLGVAPKPLCSSVGKSSTPSLGDARDCVPDPASGVTHPGTVTNSLDASGTFSSSPALSPTPGLGVDANATSSGSLGSSTGTLPKTPQTGSTTPK